MKKLLLFLIIGAVGLASCNKDEDLTVTLVQNGNLSMTLVDNNGNFISDAEVKLYQGSSELDVLTTGEDGIADFGILNVGSYSASVEAVVNGQEYFFSKGMQVVSGASKQFEVNVESYVGDLSFQFRDSNTGEDIQISGLQTALIKVNDAFNQASGLDEFLSLAVATQASNNDGLVFFEDVPQGEYYLMYYNSTDLIYDTFVYIQKDEVEYESYYANALRLAIQNKSNWSVASVVRQSDGSAVTHEYASITFDYNEGECILDRTGSLTDVQGDFYAGSLYMDFYWDSISSWYVSVESVSQNTIVIEYTDYSLGEDVVMTLN